MDDCYDKSSVLVHVISKSLYHPLSVGLSTHLAQSLGRFSTVPWVLGIETKASYDSVLSNCILARFVVVQESSINRIFVTPLFATVYGLSHNQNVRLTCVQEHHIPCNKLLVMAGSSKVWNLTQDVTQEMWIKSNVVSHQGLVLVHHPVLNAYLEYHVLCCEPLCQGVINRSTQVAVSSPAQLSSTHRSLSCWSDSMPAPCGPLLQASEPRSLSFQVAQLNFPLSFCPVEICDDPGTTVFVWPLALHILSLQIGSWVKIISESGYQFARAFVLRPYSIRGTSPNYSPEAIIVSPQLLMLLNVKTGDNVFLVADNEISFPYADKATIERVLSPESSGEAEYSSFLTRHFSIPRLVQQGTVFAVQVSETTGFFRDVVLSKQSLPSPSIQCCSPAARLVFFRVSEFQSPNKFAFIKTEKTTLIQQGSTHSFVPPCIHLFMHPIRSHHTFPPGALPWVYESIAQGLESVVTPLLLPLPVSLRSNPALLLYGPVGCGKRSLIRCLAARKGLHFFMLDFSCFVETRLQNALQRYVSQAIECWPSLLCLSGLDIIEKSSGSAIPGPPLQEVLRQCLNDLKGQPVLLVVTCNSLEDLGASTRSLFPFIHVLPVLTQSQREALIEFLCCEIPLAGDVVIEDLARQTSSLSWNELRVILSQAGVFAALDISSKLPESPPEVVRQAGVCLNWTNIKQALDQLQSHTSLVAGRPKIPNVQWKDVGGLEDAKREILDTLQVPLLVPHLFPKGMRHRSGLLLFGPPGVGKTLLAKAVATELSLSFISVKGPELINMYVGESERNVRAIFQTARAAAPCIVFFDELDSLAPCRGVGADSGGVMDRVVSQLLVELDGVQKSPGVFVVGATNRVDLVDPALLCPGRFERLVYVGICEDTTSKEKILLALSRKFVLSSDVQLARLAESCPSRLSGADLSLLCSNAYLNAIREFVGSPNRDSNGSISKPLSLPLEVSHRHFLEALRELKPSISEKELKQYAVQHRKVQSRKTGIFR